MKNFCKKFTSLPEIVELSTSIVDGEFLLASFDDNYSKFLVGMGMPSFVATLITNAREVVTFKAPSEDNGVWKMITKTGKSSLYAPVHKGLLSSVDL